MELRLSRLPLPATLLAAALFFPAWAEASRKISVAGTYDYQQMIYLYNPSTLTQTVSITANASGNAVISPDAVGVSCPTPQKCIVSGAGGVYKIPPGKVMNFCIQITWGGFQQDTGVGFDITVQEDAGFLVGTGWSTDVTVHSRAAYISINGGLPF